MHKCDLLVIGGGPAALQTGLSFRFDEASAFSVYVLSKGEIGGQIYQTPKIENLAGLPPGGISGMELIDNCHQSCLDLGVMFPPSKTGATSLQQYGDCFLIKADGNDWLARAVVIAVGTRWREHEAFKQLQDTLCRMYYGPYQTHTCDVGTYAVLGGGNSAAQGILKLADRGCSVHVLCRETLDCSGCLKERILAHKDVAIHEYTDVISVCSRPSGYELWASSGLFLRVIGVYLMVGQVPNTEWLKDSPVKLDADGYVIADPCTFTTDLPGVYAIGDCRSKVRRRSVTNALGNASEVTYEVEQYLQHKK